MFKMPINIEIVNSKYGYYVPSTRFAWKDFGEGIVNGNYKNASIIVLKLLWIIFLLTLNLIIASIVGSVFAFAGLLCVMAVVFPFLMFLFPVCLILGCLDFPWMIFQLATYVGMGGGFLYGIISCYVGYNDF